MAGSPPAAPTRADALALVDLGLRACEAYGRDDLAGRLRQARARLSDPRIHVVVVGEFKKGKSSLVNALVGSTVCPVDDDIATALPTYIRYGKESGAFLLHGAAGLDGSEPARRPIALDEVRGFVTDRGDGEGPADSTPSGVEILLPRSMLEPGLVLVDTPGLGGLGSRHAAASLAATSLADAVLFVTDASQEITAAEWDFLKRARDMCSTVAVVVTKRDFYPAWRRIVEINQGHLSGLGAIPQIPVSSALRARAVKANDKELNEESGFKALVSFVSDVVTQGAVTSLVRDAAAEVDAVCLQILQEFEAERTALADPGRARAVAQEMQAAKERAEALKEAAARWNTTLGDGIADLNSDIDYDLRARIRRVIAEADDAIEAGDPADTWSEMEPWLESRVSAELVTNYMMLRDRAVELSETVADHFRAAAGAVLDAVAVYDPTPRLQASEAVSGAVSGLELNKMSAKKQAMTALKGSYSGILMFTMLGGMVGLSLAPLAIPIGLLMGRAGLKEEKKRQLTMRQGQAKNAVRKYADEVTFVISKDSRDTLRRIQRQLRDHYSARASELQRSTSQALAAANDAAKRTEGDRQSRLKDLEAEIKRLTTLRARAAALITPAAAAVATRKTP
jgi:gas vesicle protein